MKIKKIWQNYKFIIIGALLFVFFLHIINFGYTYSSKGFAPCYEQSSLCSNENTNASCENIQTDCNVGIYSLYKTIHRVSRPFYINIYEPITVFNYYLFGFNTTNSILYPFFINTSIFCLIGIFIGYIIKLMWDIKNEI